MSETRLQFCCGENHIEGFQNFDTNCDITKLPLPFFDNSADVIFCEHGGEHFNSKNLLGFLTDCHRILKPGGVIRLCCPVVGPWLTREHARDLATGHGHEILLTEDVMRTFLWMAGFEQLRIRRTDRRQIDGHWKIIGIDKDNLETCRIEAVK